MQQHFNNKQSFSGFTIVELLIVIVIIGILAAITIVAYNGITNRAHTSTAQADANAVAKLLSVANVNAGSYPADLTTINNGSPLPSTDGTTYSYHPGSGNTSYCVTITNGSSSFKVTDTATAPVSGGCPGDGQGGVAAITNLTLNPTGDVNASNVNSMGSTGTTATYDTSTKYAGAGAIKVVGDSGNGRKWTVSDLPAGTQFTWSAYFYATTAIQLHGYGETSDSTGAYKGMSGASITIPANTWTRFSWTGTSLQGPGKSTGLGFLFNSGTAQTIWIDDVMATSGTSLATYADGNSPNWIWNGTANSSSSTGPAL